MDKLGLYIKTRVKRIWDDGIRNKNSKTGKYFKAKDIAECIKSDTLFVSDIKTYTGHKHDELSKVVGIALKKIDGDSLDGYELCSYVVDGGTAYRFVESE